MLDGAGHRLTLRFAASEQPATAHDCAKPIQTRLAL